MSLVRWRLVALAAFAGLSVAVCRPAVGQPVSYLAESDFSLSGNPNGVWSYGYSTTLSGPITLFNTAVTDPSGLKIWRTNSGTDPFIALNPTGVPINYGTAVIKGGSLAIMPNTNTYTHLLWKAPQAGKYYLLGLFYGADPTPTSTDVHILRNGSAIWNGTVNDYNVNHGYGGILALGLPGDTFDFVVGPGASWGTNDTTGLSAVVQGPGAVPLPPVALITAFGGACTMWSIRRRRK